MLPEAPAVRPRSKSDFASRQMLSRRRASALMAAASMRAARAKKSSWPKLPDFSASTSGRPATRSAGTPGAISGPISSAVAPSAWTTAPEVSPPAEISRA